MGIGVVRTNLKKLNGIVDLDSVIGGGTTVTLKLPLILAILPVLLIRVDGEIFALPLRSELEIMRVSPSQIHRTDSNENVAVDDALRARVKNLEAMPTMPAIMGPLLRTLELPAEQIEVDKIAELISCDNSIAAQRLRMANSPLFGRYKAVESIRAAVIALGARRLRDVGPAIL